MEYFYKHSLVISFITEIYIYIYIYICCDGYMLWEGDDNVLLAVYPISKQSFHMKA